MANLININNYYCHWLNKAFDNIVTLLDKFLDHLKKAFNEVALAFVSILRCYLLFFKKEL